jgi:hypothetical protein
MYTMTEIQQEMDAPKILSRVLLNKVCIKIYLIQNLQYHG